MSFKIGPYESSIKYNKSSVKFFESIDNLLNKL